MRETTARVLFAVVALVNLAPLVGVLSAARLEALYGVSVASADLEILLRHRAVLFGIVGGLLLAATVRPALRSLAAAAGLVSMLSFVVVTWLVGGYGEALERIVFVDLAASTALVGALLLDREGQTRSTRE